MEREIKANLAQLGPELGLSCAKRVLLRTNFFSFSISLMPKLFNKLNIIRMAIIVMFVLVLSKLAIKCVVQLNADQLSAGLLL